ncbi:MAG: hypothetical protein R3F13_15565 [Prosthecobacter sp.]
MSGVVLSRDEWLERAAAHGARVASHADAFVDRRSRGAKHPVHDFLFTYYSFPPAKLKQWVPPLGVSIECTDADIEARPWLQGDRFFRDEQEGLLRLNESLFTSREREFAAWVAMLCERILGRTGRFACFGLHEWAMVYRQPVEQVRHQGFELRLSPEALAAFVESQSLCCSHYDAFRFFTPEARPLNAQQPTLETRPDLEQPACLHANMDLYKWSSKLWPWTGSDLVGRCFELALAGRDLDMRASPYDLLNLGYEPIRIETGEGRAQYEREQRDLAARAEEVREALLTRCASLAAFTSCRQSSVSPLPRTGR